MSLTNLERERLKKLSKLLLEIHKVLMDEQITHYEQRNGPIPGPGRKLQLLLGDPEFQWLRTLSKNIATIDEHVFQKEPVTTSQMNSCLTLVRDLFFPEQDNEFTLPYRRYFSSVPALEVLEFNLKHLLGYQ